MAFLTLLDERARAKGSRDPLGFEMVWTHFGRKVVGNLTTITSSWRIFSVGLLGFHWCNEICRDVPQSEKLSALQNHFIRYEQLAAYLRCIGEDEEIMGITRVRKRLFSDPPPKTMTVGSGQAHQILSDQISYGIWGLYSTAMRESSLVTGDFRELTDRGLEIVSLIEKGLDKRWYTQLISRPESTLSMEQLQKNSDSFIRAIADEKIKNALIETLLLGSSNHSCQEALYHASSKIEPNILDSGSSLEFIRAIQEKASSQELELNLNNIVDVERLLVTANILFDYCRRKDGEPMQEIAEHISQYDFDYLPERPLLEDCPYSVELNELRHMLKRRKILEAVQTLLNLNKKIMNNRGGAAWAEVSNDDTLRVRINSEKSTLPAQGDLETIWHYNYFLSSFARIAHMGRT